MLPHLLFAVYWLLLAAGIALLTALWNRLKQQPGGRELIWLYGLLSGFMISGGTALYVYANIARDPIVVQLFQVSAYCLIGGFCYWLPRFFWVSTQRQITQRQHNLFKLGALLGPAAGFSLPFIQGGLHLVVATLPIAALTAAVVYGCTLKRQGRTGHLRFQLGLPLLFIAAGALEGLMWGEQVIERGVTLSLPLIYGIANAALWLSRERLFPTCSDSTADEAANPAARPLPERLNLNLLTAKEVEVVHAVRAGLSNKQVAGLLEISPSTVKNHLHNIFKKLAVTSRTALFAQLQKESAEAETRTG